MQEAQVRFAAQPGLELEGMFRRGSGDRGAVVCHPHPLHGGDMHNPVVATAAAAYAEAGRSVLRFNFRGTGASQGSHGRGSAEVDDLRGAVSFMLAQGVSDICLVGYSFGAFVIAQLPEGEGAAERVLIAPPVQVMDFSAVGVIEGLSLVVTGSLDELAPPSAVAVELPTWNPDARLEVVQGADHFFGAHLHALRKVLV